MTIINNNGFNRTVRYSRPSIICSWCSTHCICSKQSNNGVIRIAFHGNYHLISSRWNAVEVQPLNLVLFRQRLSKLIITIPIHFHSSSGIIFWNETVSSSIPLSQAPLINRCRPKVHDLKSAYGRAIITCHKPVWNPI